MVSDDRPRKAPAYESGHFYSPVVNTADIAARRNTIWKEHPAAAGVDFNDASHRHILEEVMPRHMTAFDYPERGPADGELDHFYVRNSQFSYLDCRLLFALLREWRPRRMIEVGGGYSTLLSMDVNTRFLDNAMNFTCIEPYPRPFLLEERDGLTRLVQERVEKVPLGEFEALEAGDVLFIDSSHVCKTGSDVNHLFLEVLPRLRDGVRVHVHDVFLPGEYPPEWVLTENRSWNEQYLLQAMLAHNPRYRVLFGAAYAFLAYPDRINIVLGLPDGVSFGGGSFWFKVNDTGQVAFRAPQTMTGEMNERINPAVRDAAAALHEQFQSAQPFRHVAIDNFLDEGFCRQLTAAFPAFDERLAVNEDGVVGAKAVHEKVTALGPAWQAYDELVQSAGFRDFISAITGVEDLQYDPHYFGGGTHENLHGQGLNAHIDFNYHPITRQHRRLNLIIYLTEEWRDEWGGSIQLHRDPYLPPAQDEIVTITPKFNRAVIFETNEYSWHGFPHIDLPEDKRHLSRKSIALYYYTDTRPEEETGPEHSTIYVDRHLPEDFHAGMVLEAGQLQRMRELLAGRDQHLKRLYGHIQQLNTHIGNLQHLLEGSEEAAEESVLADLGDDSEVLRAAASKLQRRVEELENSTSWRLTAPLRAVKRFIARQ